MSRRLPLQVLAGFLAAAQAVAAAPVDVYILTGQSNSLGTTKAETDYSPGSHPADSVIRIFWANVGGTGWPVTLLGTSTNLFIPLQMQQGGYGSPYFWGPEFGFARTLYDAGRTNFVIIKASNAGGGNTLWDKAAFDANHNNGPMWGHVSNTVNTALGVLAASGRSFNVRGLLYIQGEANSLAEASIAASRFSLLFSNLMAAVNTTYPGTATGMCAVIGEIAGSQSTTTNQLTTTQQVAVAYSNNAIAFVGTRDQPLKANDLPHFPKSAKLEIGRRMANCFLGRPTIVSVGFDAVTNASDATSLIFERYAPDTNGVTDSVNLNAPGTFTGFGDGASGQPRAGLLVSGSAGRVVFADYYNTSVTSDIACGQYDFAGHGLPAGWADSGTAVSFAFADPTNQASNALVSAAAFEIVALSTNNLVTVSLYDGRGDALYTSGVLTNGRFGFEAHEAFSEVLTSAVARVTLQGATNVLWTIGHVTDGGVPDFAWNGWRLPSGYERWSFQIPDPALRGDTTDPDGDGALNLLEYSTGTDPTNKVSLARLAGVWTNGGFAVRFPRANADDITWRVERAADLSGHASWDTLATKQGSQPWSGPAVVEETDNGSLKLVLVHDPDSSAKQHYLRLRVTRP